MVLNAKGSRKNEPKRFMGVRNGGGPSVPSPTVVMVLWRLQTLNSYGTM
jgi:hypothetical protein